MVAPEDAYRSLMAVNSLASLAPQDALGHIGTLTDLSLDMGRTEGLERAIRLLEELQARKITPGQLATSHYFLANAWANLRTLRRRERDQLWDWEQVEIEQEIIHLRKASREAGLHELPDERKCQVLTNLGNVLNHVGRFAEAIEYWDKALRWLPRFGMARGNRGLGLASYARALYDDGHATLFLKYAHRDLAEALSSALHDNAREGFEGYRSWIESVLPPAYLKEDTDVQNFSLGEAEQEVRYRRWCLNQRLFLNPLNDLAPNGSYPKFWDAK